VGVKSSGGCLFSVVYNSRKRDNRQKLEHRMFCTKVVKNFFSQSYGALEQVAQRGCVVSVYGEVQDLSQCPLVSVPLYSSRGVGLDDLLRFLPTPAIQ